MCFHVHHLIKVRMWVPEQESPLHGTQVFKALGHMLKADAAEVCFRRGGLGDPAEIFCKAQLCQGWWHRKVRSMAGCRSSRGGLWARVSVSLHCPHHQVRSLLPFSISPCRGCKDQCTEDGEKNVGPANWGKGSTVSAG